MTSLYAGTFSEPISETPPHHSLAPAQVSSVPTDGSALQTLKLDLSSRCNIACDYCFVDEGKVLPGPKAMPDDTIRSAIEWFATQNEGQGSTVVLFGGEPLVNRSGFQTAYDQIRALRQKGQNIRLQIITNAILATPEVCAKLADVSASVMVSVDGNREQHDTHRLDHRGRGTYHQTIQGLRNLQQTLPDGDIWVRATMVGGTSQIDYVDEILSLGVRQVSLGYVDDMPPIQLTRAAYSSEIDTVIERIIEYALRGIQIRVHPYSAYLSLIYGVRGRGASWPRNDCGAATRIVTLTPDGVFYPCEHAVRVRDVRDWSLGDVRSGIDSSRVMSFLDQTGRTNKGCQTCSRSNFCDQGCRVESTINSTRDNCHGRDQMLDVLWSRLEWWYDKLFDEAPAVLLRMVDAARYELNRSDAAEAIQLHKER